jgi:hypothetical protein
MLALNQSFDEIRTVKVMIVVKSMTDAIGALICRYCHRFWWCQLGITACLTITFKSYRIYGTSRSTN